MLGQCIILNAHSVNVRGHHGEGLEGRRERRRRRGWVRLRKVPITHISRQALKSRKY